MGTDNGGAVSGGADSGGMWLVYMRSSYACEIISSTYRGAWLSRGVAIERRG